MESHHANGLSREQEMFSLIAEHKASEMTVKDFCKLYDMAQSRYYYWQKKYQASLEGKQASGQNGFRLLEVQQREDDLPVQGIFAEYRGIRFYRELSVSFLKALIS